VNSAGQIGHWKHKLASARASPTDEVTSLVKLKIVISKKKRYPTEHLS
jgi:hypothetical protein